MAEILNLNKEIVMSNTKVKYLKKMSSELKLQASKKVFEIMKTEGCSSCCNLSSGGNSKLK